MKMQAALWYGPEHMQVVETDVPEISDHEVLVKIGASLTCGTDFKLFRRGHPMLAKNIPAPFGHEMAGTIVSLGQAVKNFRVGDRVVAANSAPCGHCFYCHHEQFNLCEDLLFLTGAYAEYIKIPSRIVEKNLHRIPDALPFQEAAAAEPLACVVHCMDRIQLHARETICIVGAGPCGLFFVQLAKQMGAKVICVGRTPEKLAAAKQFGADHVVSVLDTEDPVKEVHQLANGGYGPDAVVEAAGMPETWELSTRLVRKGGRVCFYGGCAKGTQVSLDTHRTHYEELNFFGVFHHTPFHFAKSIALLSEGKIKVKNMIGGERRLKDLNQVFQKGVKETPLKIAIIP